jgi:hypothetical protein
MEVNEKKREHEELEKQVQFDEADLQIIDKINQNIKLMQLPNGAKLSDFGRLRKSGDVTVFSDAHKVADYAFLFDMVIVLCHKPKWLQQRFRFREAAKVKDYLMETLPLDSAKEEVFSVRLCRRTDIKKASLTFITKTPQERDAWFASIMQAMDSVSPVENAEQGHVLQMTTFGEPTDCFQCSKPLRGSFFQGYRCLRCQVNLHKACISNCPCLEVGSIKRVDSVSLPTALPDSLERSNSTLSLAAPDRKPHGSRLSGHLLEMQVSEMNHKIVLYTPERCVVSEYLSVGFNTEQP